MDDSNILRIDKDAMIRVLNVELTFSELFMAYLLSRNIHIEEDLVNQLCHHGENLFARVLLPAHCLGKEAKLNR